MQLLTEAGERTPIRLLGWCLMPNHFHLLVWPINDGDLSQYMALRESIQRGRPFGDAPWMIKTAEELGIESSLRPRGRPRKEQAEESQKSGALFD